MRGLNRVMLVGRLGRDPEFRTTAGGATWATFSLATGRSRKEGDQWVEATDWHRVKIFGTQAALCQGRIGKGSMVLVEGGIVYDTWTGKDGVKRTSSVIMGDRVTFLDTRGVSAPEVAAAAASEPMVAEAK